MEERQFHLRALSIVAILGVLVLVFFGVLWNLQVVHGEDYLAQSTRKIANRETVEAARGELLDRYGRVLVSNRATYQVSLDTSVMGEEPERNATLLELLDVCRDLGMTWEDTLPISADAPFTYTTDQPLSYTVENEDGTTSTGRTRLARLLDALPLKNLPANPTAQEVVDALRAYFEVDDSVSDADARALVGVLYEINLRKQEIVQTEYLFAQDVGIEFISVVKERSLPGVGIEPATARQYNTSCAAHLLGRVGKMDSEEWKYYQDLGYNMNDTVGKDGVELAFEEYLRGEAGIHSLELSTTGKGLSETWEIDPETGAELVPKPGDNVILTLDLNLQEKVEQVLADTIESLTSKDKEGGAAVVLDVKDGSVLAMASYPTFDLANVYLDQQLYTETSENPLNPFYNRATYGLYSPGSTFKPLVGIAALKEGVTTPSETILDTGRFTLPEEEHYPYGDSHPQCWAYRQYGYTHGREHLADALRDSCNIYFYTMGHRLGIDLIDQYAARFGLGEYTGLELPEYKGQVAGPETSEKAGNTWYGGEVLNAAIGQGDTLCTPIQLANYIATLVNGGNHYATHLLKSVKSSDYSQTVYEYEPQLLDTLDLNPDNVEAVKLGMWKVANDSESSVYRYFRDLSVEVGAKTGTAQVAADVEATAVFVCFAPYDDPQIAMAIVAEKGGSGGELAGAAAQILAYYFNAEQTLEAPSTENALLR